MKNSNRKKYAKDSMKEIGEKVNQDTAKKDRKPKTAASAKGYTGCFLCDGKVMTVRFVDEAHHGMYLSQLMDIRNTNTQINRDGGIQSLPTEEFNRRVSAWIVLCIRFLECWGFAVVPTDVRRAWNDAEMVLGRNPTIPIDEVENENEISIGNDQRN